MQLVLYRGEASLPESISGLAVSNRYIATAQSSGVIELFSNPHLFSLARIDIGMRNIQTMEFNGDVLVIGSLTQGIAYVDTLTMAVKKEKKEGVWKVLCRQKQELVIYSLVEGGSEVFVNGSFVYRNSGYISAACFGQNRNEYVLGMYDGRIIKIENGRATMDIILDKTRGCTEAVMDIVHIVGDEYGCCTMEGSFHVIDVNQRVVKQTISVRNSSLNTMCTMGDKVFMAGADSRIICYTKAGKYYRKESQDDVCYADCLFMRESNGNIVVASEDGTLTVVHLHKTEKRLVLRKYPTHPVAYTNDKVYSAAKEEMSIFNVERPDEENDSIRSKCIFKHIAKSPILDIKSLDSLSFIRTKEGVRAYEYNHCNTAVNMLAQIKGTVIYHTIINRRIWCVMEKKKRLVLTVVELDSNKDAVVPEPKEWILTEIGVSFVPTHITEGRSECEVLISGSDIILFNTTDNKHVQISSKETEYFLGRLSNNRIYGVGQSIKAELKDSRILTVFDLKGKKLEETGMVFKTPIMDIQVLNKEIFIACQNEIKILEETKEIKTLDVSAVIDGICVDNKEIFAMQRPWQFTQQKLPLQVFKEKYGRR
ncbi:hypothetical protein NEIRO03_1164 [Nematocida sp. AWRm78]|nr:hypothetical protein NEIRO02_1234 [Nematocida sp. AWRm79]KAI5183582.1 hypothetical protein NEIRO03_1164 [Nematocida sp. AWRm78]